MAAKLKLLQARQAQIFSDIQDCYDHIGKYNVDKTLRSTLLSKATIVEANYQEFKNIINDIQELKINEDPEYIPDFNVLKSANDLLGYIKFAVKQLEKSAREPAVPEQPKLPTLDLPWFDGNINHWTIFFETFKAVVHLNRALTDDQKMQYLVSRLKGSALSICAGIPTIGANYEAVWKALQTRYQDKRTLAGVYVEQILNFKQFKIESKAALQDFIDIVGASVLALKGLGIQDLAEFLLYCLTIRKMDPESRKRFESSILAADGMPKFSDLLEYVQGQVRVMERTEILDAGSHFSKAQHGLTSKSSNKNSKYFQKVTFITADIKKSCPVCKNASHPLYHCSEFLNLKPYQRLQFVKAQKMCFNCLSSNHMASACQSKSNCRKCGFKHNTLLHLQDYSPRNTLTGDNWAPRNVINKTDSSDSNTPCTSSTEQVASPKLLDNVVCHASHRQPHSVDSSVQTTVLLSTVKVAVKDRSGETVLIRMLLDNASMSNFITYECCKKLGIKYQPVVVGIGGIGGSHKDAKGIAKLLLSSRYDPNIQYKLSALVIDKVTDLLPICKVDINKIPGIEEAHLSDDDFHIPGIVDGLIGAELFAEIIGRMKLKKTSSNMTSASIMESTLGDVVMGKVPILSTDNNFNSNFCAFVETPSLESLMEKFWTLEEVTAPKPLSFEEKQCEEMFQSTVQYRDDGRYCVSLPFKVTPSVLGSSYNIAERRFLQLERKLISDSDAKNRYTNAITEYMKEGYAKCIEITDKESLAYYMPHRAVERPDKSSTKTRIVFDLSCKTKSGLSLNDTLHTGPTLYKNLFDLLISFCMFPVTCTADIRKMFLQIYVNKEDQKFQRFLWRNSPEDPLQCYEMERIVFGMRPSPFLAQRVLKQLAEDNMEDYPSAAREVNQSFYMDDFLASFCNEVDARNTINELVIMLKKGGFVLSKFAANKLDILQDIPEDQKVISEVEWNKDHLLKVLGIQWNPKEDAFSFLVNITNVLCTKRSILSTVARIFDVIGFLSPVTITLKFLIRDLWSLNIDWDEEPPMDIKERWSQIVTGMHILDKLKIPRHLGIFSNSKVSLVGFSDASEKALGACLFVHVTQPDNTIHVQLICARAKVAPMKFVTIPRLELCAALMLANLLLTVKHIFESKITLENVLCLTDSMVSLCWISSDPSRWNTFVANRVSKIHEVVPKENWHHVSGTENPADILSRGTSPQELLNMSLYWNGPEWLHLPREQWPLSSQQLEVPVSLLEERKASTLHVVQKEEPSDVLLTLANRISSWNILLRTIVYIFKFGHCLPQGPISVEDLAFAENRLLSALQATMFKEDLSNLKKGEVCSNKLMKLKPFIKDGLLRCGGRIEKANLAYEHVHPILLPKSHHIINLLIDNIHVKNYHTGPHLVTSILRKKYWILGCRDIVRRRVQKCNICFKTNPKPIYPIMSTLPSPRVQESAAFHNTGVDYAGPFQVTLTRRRGVRAQKAYLCLFVCLATKALHLELASDLSTATFLAALKRFIARRGTVRNIYSDQGSNFIGAANALNDLYALLNSQEFTSCYTRELLNVGIQFHFNPPASPHFGGLWESNVRAVKNHLYRSIGTQILTYEELNTVFTGIECILNSRPLCPLSSEPGDPQVLTPAHFLMQNPPTHLPFMENNNADLKLGDRYKLLQQLILSFWKRWSTEYLSTLQQRYKWTKNDPNVLKLGLLVLIKSENTPVLSWPIGKIIQLFPGNDGISRVALIKTSHGTFKRPAVKLCPLPSQ